MSVPPPWPLDGPVPVDGVLELFRVNAYGGELVPGVPGNPQPSVVDWKSNFCTERPGARGGGGEGEGEVGGAGGKVGDGGGFGEGGGGGG